MTTKKNKTTFKSFVNNIAQKIKNNIKDNAGVWVENFDRSCSFDLPINCKSIEYKGVNIFALLLAQMENGYKYNQWFTFKQISDLGGKVIKGEKSHEVFFFTTYYKKETAKNDTTRFINGTKTEIKKGDEYKLNCVCPKLYRVFNIAQTNLNYEETTTEKNNINLNQLIDFHKPEIIHHDISKACYVPKLDVIKIPHRKYFKTDEDYQATLLHEFSHWTMHKNRLNRVVDFSCKKSYAKEEIIAELSSTILLKHFGINGEVKNHDFYIKHYLEFLTDDDYVEAVKSCVKVFSFLLKVDIENEYKNAA